MNERRRSSTYVTAGGLGGRGFEHLLAGLGIPCASSVAFGEQRRHSGAVCLSVRVPACLSVCLNTGPNYCTARPSSRPAYVLTSDVPLLRFVFDTWTTARKCFCDPAIILLYINIAVKKLTINRTASR